MPVLIMWALAHQALSVYTDQPLSHHLHDVSLERRHHVEAVRACRRLPLWRNPIRAGTGHGINLGSEEGPTRRAGAVHLWR